VETRTLPHPWLRTWPLIAGIVVALTAVMVVFGQSAQAATAFSDDFEDGDYSGWSKSGGDWYVVADGSKVLSQTKTDSENARQFAGSSGWNNYTVTASVKPVSLGSGGYVALLARSTGSTTFYRLALLPGNTVQLQAVNSGSVTVLGSASRTIATGTWYTLAIETNGTTIRGLVNGVQVASATSSLISTGRIGLQTSYSSANFDNVLVTTGTSTPSASPSVSPSSATSPSPRPSASASASASPRPSTSTSTPPVTGWPTKTGDAPVSNGTIPVSGTFDGGMKRYCCIGDGGQGESQDPVFELQPGATIKNVILGAPAGDGIHCLGSCTIQNVWWEDVGEDAATFLGGSSSNNYYVIGGGARHASDKVFQHNGAGTVHISGFYAEDIGKLYRGCGNCTTSYQRHTVIDNIRVTDADAIAGINTNWGDTARFTRITLINDPSHSIDICLKYKGVPKGSEPTLIGSGADGVNCFYSPSDIIYQ
jgi:pectate lyase